MKIYWTAIMYSDQKLLNYKFALISKSVYVWCITGRHRQENSQRKLLLLAYQLASSIKTNSNTDHILHILLNKFQNTKL